MLGGAEFESILVDQTKEIVGDIRWTTDEDHSHCVEFRMEVSSAGGWPLFIKGTYNPLIPALSYSLILKTDGRIYGLDLGKDHHNPQCNQVGECHKHRWTEQGRDKEAYKPVDITATASDPVATWNQFCAEAAIVHRGRMHPPAPPADDLFWLQ
ncbi:hypothetical protein CKO42_25455 [Lamprobacter modestohalophilus]|uniref:Uncharacterized protein n=1 Tax=Lamprobacter modestohalophilus TaxID=1064514 RepID=A0A9X1B7A0_9GAMM|nr:hypothetical protein [Lamprobacter modestohalophilus]MBK1621676.1 hypothetical protein [Lamprobacter modestohalophilus]